MAKKPKMVYYIDESQVALEMIRSITKLAQDPLISSMVSWWWLQKRSTLGWDDRQLLKLGIIDINRSRAGVESSVAFDLMDRAKELIQGISQSTALAAGAAAAPEVAAAGAAGMFAQDLFTSKRKPTQEEVTRALQVLEKAGAEFK